MEVEQKAKEEGYRKGENLAQQHYQELLAEAEEFRKRSITEYEDTIRSLEHDIVELSLNIARKVLGAELETSREAILKIAGEAIDACLNKDQIILRVSVEDYDYVMENIEHIKNRAGDIGQIEIRKDRHCRGSHCGYRVWNGGQDWTKMEMVNKLSGSDGEESG